MRPTRTCFKQACSRPAVATLTFDYGESVAVLGPLASMPHPQAYDLCAQHANNLTVPKGWEVIRLETKFEEADPTEDDMMALADAVRAASHTQTPPSVPSSQKIAEEKELDRSVSRHPAGRRYHHFRVLSGGEDYQ